MDIEVYTERIVSTVEGIAATGDFVEDISGLVEATMEVLTDEYPSGSNEGEWVDFHRLTIGEIAYDVARELVTV